MFLPAVNPVVTCIPHGAIIATRGSIRPENSKGIDGRCERGRGIRPAARSGLEEEACRRIVEDDAAHPKWA